MRAFFSRDRGPPPRPQRGRRRSPALRIGTPAGEHRPPRRDPRSADRAIRERLVQQMLVLTDPHHLPPPTLHQITVRPAAYVLDEAAELARLEEALRGPRAGRAFKAVLRARTTQLKTRHALADPPEGTWVRPAVRAPRPFLHAHLNELAALAAPEAPATEHCR